MSTILSALAAVAASPACSCRRPTWPPCSRIRRWSSSPSARTRRIELGHVPGARFVLYGDIAIDANGLHPNCRRSTAARVLANAGISDRSKVIIYGSTIAATRLFFTLDYFGHPRRVLNGGQRVEGIRRRG